MDEAGRYLLVMEQFILKPEYIFQDTETGEFFFCYLPFYDGSLETDFRELAENILKRLDHSQEEAVLWGYDIYSRSAEEHFSIGKILRKRSRDGRRKKQQRKSRKNQKAARRLRGKKKTKKGGRTGIYRTGRLQQKKKSVRRGEKRRAGRKNNKVREKGEYRKRRRENVRRNGTPKQKRVLGREKKKKRSRKKSG